MKQEGYRRFKLKIGHKELQKTLIASLPFAKRSATRRLIRVDGNATYSFTEAREMLNALSRFHLSDAEQPLARGDLKSLAELRRAVGVPIAAQESVSSPEDALAVLDAGAADLLKIKLTHIGGFQRALTSCRHRRCKRVTGGRRPRQRLYTDHFRPPRCTCMLL